MNKDELIAKQEAATAEFNNLQSEVEKHEAEIKLLNQRLFELRGQHQAYQVLLNELVTDEATTIKVAEKKNGK